MSFFFAHSWSAFVLAKRDRHGANKNEITIFVFSVTAKDFSHLRALVAAFAANAAAVSLITVDPVQHSVTGLA